MSKVLDNLQYAESHEWLKVDAASDDQGSDKKVYILGISDYAQHHLGDLVFVNLPEVGSSVEKDKEIAVVESVKSASDIYTPVTGIVVEVNTTLLEQPEIINNDPYGEGWMVKIKATSGDMGKLLSADEYAGLIGN